MPASNSRRWPEGDGGDEVELRGLAIEDPADRSVEPTQDEVLLKRGRTSQTQLQVHLSSCSSSLIRACEER